MFVHQTINIYDYRDNLLCQLSNAFVYCDLRGYDCRVKAVHRRYGAPTTSIVSRMSFSSDQVSGTVFPHLNMPFLPNSEFIYNIVLVGGINYRSYAPILYGDIL